MKTFSLLPLLLAVVVLPAQNQITVSKYNYNTVQSFNPNTNEVNDGEKVKMLREEYEAIVEGQDTIKNGKYTHYHEFSNKIKQTGFFKNGKKEGEFTDFYGSGQTKWVRTYEGDRIVGKEAFFSLEGTPLQYSKYILKNDSITIFAKFHSNGKLSSKGQMLHEELHGTIEQYYPDGNISLTANYANGKQEGEFITYFENGNIRQKGSMKHEMLEGRVLTYYPSGKIAQEGDFVYGKIDPKLVTYYEDGTKKSVGEYQNGRLNGQLIEYHPSGSLAHKANYLNGKLVGEELFYYENNVTIMIFF